MTFTATCRKITVTTGHPTGCDITFTDPAGYVAHMKDIHDRKLNLLYSVEHQRMVAWKPALPLSKPRRAPRTAKPFEAEPPDPGADVTWRQLVDTDQTRSVWKYDPQLRCDTRRDVPIQECITRTGQVWSLGDLRKTIWVVPYEPLPGERAVLLRQYNDRLDHERNWDEADVQRWKAAS
jgi:hypothetical protein